jgi:hypothetical protein
LRSSTSSRAAHLGLLSSIYSCSILAAAAPSGRGGGGRGGGHGPRRRSARPPREVGAHGAAGPDAAAMEPRRPLAFRRQPPSAALQVRAGEMRSRRGRETTLRGHEVVALRDSRGSVAALVLVASAMAAAKLVEICSTSAMPSIHNFPERRIHPLASVRSGQERAQLQCAILCCAATCVQPCTAGQPMSRHRRWRAMQEAAHHR